MLTINHNKKISSRIKGKVVVLTGASSGIGKACALEFSRQGAKVVLASRNFEALKNVESQIISNGGEVMTVKTDVKLMGDCQNLITKTIEKYGRIDVLINNAGVSMRANFGDIDMKLVGEVMDTNFTGAVYCTRFALPHLLENKGVVVGISSISGLAPLPGRTIYCASKYALDGFLNTLRIENLKNRLQVLVVHPGFTSSNIRNNALNASGLPQGESPRNENKMMTAEKLAKIVSKSVFTRKTDILLTTQGKLIVWFYWFFPRFTDWIIYRQMKKESQAPF